MPMGWNPEFWAALVLATRNFHQRKPPGQRPPNGDFTNFAVLLLSRPLSIRASRLIPASIRTSTRSTLNMMPRRPISAVRPMLAGHSFARDMTMVASQLRATRSSGTPGLARKSTSEFRRK